LFKGILSFCRVELTGHCELRPVGLHAAAGEGVGVDGLSGALTMDLRAPS
jgi:hypothetical protein